MRLADDGTLRLSPTDLANHLACAHLTQLELLVQRGELARPHVDDPYGRAHHAEGERARGCATSRGSRPRGYARLRACATYDDEGFDADEARRATEEAIRERGGRRHLPGLPLGRHLARVRRLPRAPARRHVRARRHEARALREAAAPPPALLLRRAARADPGAAARARPRRARLGRARDASGRPSSSRSSAGARERLLAAIAGERARPTPGPWPVYHCTICDFRHLCREQRVEEDHPILVAGLARLHAERLAAAGITTLTALAETAPDDPGRRASGRRRSSGSARRPALQLHFTRDGRAARRAPPGRGGPRLPHCFPPPSDGDVWLDLEGHPFYEPARGLEYLFGWCYRDEDGEMRYEVVWGLDRAAEKAAFERFVDWVEERRRRPPRPARLPLRGVRAHRAPAAHGRARHARARDRRLAAPGACSSTSTASSGSRCAHRRDELLDQGDREALRLRAHGRGRGRGRVGRPLRAVARGPGGLAARGDPRVQRGGLPLDGRAPRVAPRAAAGRAPLAGAARAAGEDGGGRGAGRERIALHEALLDGRRRASPRWLLAHLLYYHQREAKSQWWEWFHHLALDEDELIEDTDTIGGMRARRASRCEDGQSLVYTFTFPAQEHKIHGRRSVDPKTEKRLRRLDRRRAGDRDASSVRRSARTSRCRRRSFPGADPDPEQRDAVQRFARGVPRRRARRRASGEILERRAAAGAARPARAGRGALARGQPPLRPGPAGLGEDLAGREGGRRAHARGPAGRRHLAQPQGDLASSSHEIEREAREQGFAFVGRKKSTRAGTPVYEGRLHRLERRLARPARRGAPARRRHVVALRARRLRRASSTR